MRGIVLALLLVCTVVTVAQPRPGGPPPGDPWAYGPNGPGNWDRSWNNRPVPRRGACFYRDWKFQGDHFCIRSGDRLPFLPGGFGNSISSIQTFGGARVSLFDGARFEGGKIQIRQPVVDMRNVRGREGRSWNDRVSSMSVN